MNCEYQHKVNKKEIPVCNILGVNIAAINMDWLCGLVLVLRSRKSGWLPTKVWWKVLWSALELALIILQETLREPQSGCRNAILSGFID